MAYYQDPDIFLTYANTPLGNDPTELLKTLKVIEKAAKAKREELPWITDVQRVIGRMFHFNEKSKDELGKKTTTAIKEYEDIEGEIADNWMDYENKSGPNPFLHKLYEHRAKIEMKLFSLVSNLGCHRPDLNYLVSFPECSQTQKHFFNTDNIKCFDCEQRYFVLIVQHILSGGSLTRLENLVSRMPTVRSKYEINREENDPAKERIRKVMVMDDSHERALAFPFVVWEAASKSLIHFLFISDRKKLKKCSQCRNFYIQKKLNPEQKYCSDKCRHQSRWSKEKWNDYINKRRERERIEKKRARSAALEGEVKRIMGLGFPRADAIEMAKENMNV